MTAQIACPGSWLLAHLTFPPSPGSILYTHTNYTPSSANSCGLAIYPWEDKSSEDTCAGNESRLEALAQEISESQATWIDPFKMPEAWLSHSVLWENTDTGYPNWENTASPTAHLSPPFLQSPPISLGPSDFSMWEANTGLYAPLQASRDVVLTLPRIIVFHSRSSSGGHLKVWALFKPEWVASLPLSATIMFSGRVPLTWHQGRKSPPPSPRERRESCQFPSKEISFTKSAFECLTFPYQDCWSDGSWTGFHLQQIPRGYIKLFLQCIGKLFHPLYPSQL